jgi:hypothetical protein
MNGKTRLTNCSIWRANRLNYAALDKTLSGFATGRFLTPKIRSDPTEQLEFEIY